MVAGRVTLEIALAVALLATAIGALWGALAGFTGGALDALMMRVVDTLMALPAIFVLIYLATIIQPTVLLLIGVISLLSWLGPARLVRGETLSLGTREFVYAARAMGAGRTRTIVHHLLPNTLGTIVVRIPSRSPTRSCWSRRSASWASGYRHRLQPGEGCSPRARATCSMAIGGRSTPPAS